MIAQSSLSEPCFPAVIPAANDIICFVVALACDFLVFVLITIFLYKVAFERVLVLSLLFTVIFMVTLSIVSRVSNSQMVMTTATYRAILVVFIANTLPKFDAISGPSNNGVEIT
jgi:hypothetical protein